MKRILIFLTIMALTIPAFVFYSSPAISQVCQQRGIISSDTPVFENLPRYITGVSWEGKLI